MNNAMRNMAELRPNMSCNMYFLCSKNFIFLESYTLNIFIRKNTYLNFFKDTLRKQDISKGLVDFQWEFRDSGKKKSGNSSEA